MKFPKTYNKTISNTNLTNQKQIIMFTRLLKITLPALSALVILTAPSFGADNKAKAGFNNTPFIKDINWFARDANGNAIAQDSKWRVHDIARPEPETVKGTYLTTPAPTDAEVLFDGTEDSLKSSWKPGRRKGVLWTVNAAEKFMVAKGNDLVTQKDYGNVQLHVEWRIPAGAKGHDSYGVNSGVFFMGGRYEIQLLESSDQNSIYADGTVGALYGQFPPLVNASLPKGEWNSFDIVFTVPRFDKSGKVISPAFATVIHNGIVVQANQPMNGPIAHKGAPSYKAHPERLPINLQFHGDPVHFRNIWIRELKQTPVEK
jgi:hypothetical protein